MAGGPTPSTPHARLKHTAIIDDFFFFFGCTGSVLLHVGYSLVAVLGLCIAVTSVVAEHWL